MNSELQKIYMQLLGNVRDVEVALIEQLPQMASLSTRPDLTGALNDHLEETKLHKDRIEEFAREATGNDQPFRSMLEEAAQIAATIQDTEVRDRFIIASAQTVEHYEIARYEALITWAEELGESDAVELLNMNLAEEEAALSNLSELSGGMDMGDVVEDLSNHL